MARKIFKTLFFIFCGILLLLIVAICWLYSPAGQNFVRGKLVNFLHKKIKTEVYIGHIGVGFPEFIVIKDVLLLDERCDTLVSATELRINLDMWGLLNKKVNVRQIELSGFHSHIYRNAADTNYNFTYIIEAFTSGEQAPTTQKKETVPSSPEIKLDRLRLRDFHVRFDDSTGGTKLAMNLDELDLKMKELDLDKMIFHIGDLSVSNLQTTYEQDSSLLPPSLPDTSRAVLKLKADYVNLKNVGVVYTDQMHHSIYMIHSGTLQLQLQQFSLADNLLDISKLLIGNTSVSMALGKRTSQNLTVDSAGGAASANWLVKVRELGISGLAFKMDDENYPRVATGMDCSHLDFKNIDVDLHQFRYTTDTITGDLKHLALTERCGLDLKELRTEFIYNQQGAILAGLYLKTANSQLQNYMEAHYPSLSFLEKNLNSLQLNIKAENSTISMKDVLLFTPVAYQKDLLKYRNERIVVDLEMTGNLDDLDIKKLRLSCLGNTKVLLNGVVKGLPDPDKLAYDLRISEFGTSARDISTVVPDSMLQVVRVPDQLGLTGNVAGTLKDYKLDLAMQSTDGFAGIFGQVSTSPGAGKESYDIHVRTMNLDVGHVIKKDSLLGQVTVAFHAQGEGFDPKTMHVNFEAGIPSAFVKGYRYHNVSITGSVSSEVATIDFMSVDTNLQVQLTSEVDFSGKFLAAKGDVRLDSIDLQALKLYNGDSRAHGVIHFDFPVMDPDFPKGAFTWWKPVVNAGGYRYYLDSIYVTSSPDHEGQHIDANLDFLHAHVTGTTPMTKIGDIIKNNMDHYFATLKPRDSIGRAGDTLGQDNSRAGGYTLRVEGDLVDKPMLHGIFPALGPFDLIHFNGKLSPGQLDFHLKAPEIIYGSASIGQTAIDLAGTDTELNYKITADNLSQGPVRAWFANMNGKIKDNKISANISLADESGKERFAIAANRVQAGDSQIIQLMPGLMLNYKKWNVAQPNRVVLTSSGFYIWNFGISDSDQSIVANSHDAVINAPLDVDFKNFRLSNITDVLSSSDTLLADGLLSGKIAVEKISPFLQMNSDLNIQNLTVLGDTLGNLQANISDIDEKSLALKIGLKGMGNAINVSGDWYPKIVDGNEFNLAINGDALALHSFESLLAGQARNSGGFIRGKLHLSGTTEAPILTGELQTDSLVTTISRLNATFKMPAEKIEFTKNLITFDNFTLHDSADNKAVVTGTISTADLNNMQMNMKVNAANWRALHSTIKDNKDFYGNMLITVNMEMKGAITMPSINGTLKILKGTNVTVVNTESEPALQSTDGIVIFENMKDTGRLNVLIPRTKDTTKHKMAAGSDLNLNISVDKNAAFTLIIDQQSGDFISAKGEASINASVSPGGVVSLSGNYELSEGTYQMDYNFIKRKFQIQSGSVITFAGDPIKGTNMDINATYLASAPPYDLMVTSGNSDAPPATYKQDLPFQVDLYLKGNVLQPAISFNVLLPENKIYPLASTDIESIQGKLSQVRADTTQLNKQVFALLILGRFVSDNPFQSGVSNSTTFTAMQSLSSFIGAELNQAAGKYIKGVDFSADLATTQDYTNGTVSGQQRTDLNLSASKRLLNDRLKLTVGNDFELDGPQTSNQSTFVPSNLSADYLLTSDGKLTTRVYRKMYNAGVLEGYITETGLDLIVNLNFTHFKDIFKGKEKSPPTPTPVPQNK